MIKNVLGVNYSFKYESLMYAKACKIYKMYKISSESVILAQTQRKVLLKIFWKSPWPCNVSW